MKQSTGWFIFIISLSILASGCDQQTNNKKLAVLENIISSQGKSITELDKKITDIDDKIYNMALSNASKTIAILHPDSKDFQPIETSMGILYVKLINIHEYANGYEVVLGIGNPNNAVFSNLDISIIYGKTSKNYNVLDFSSSKQSKTTILNDLKPGYWNKESIILAPANKEDLEHMWVTITPNSTKLRELSK